MVIPKAFGFCIGDKCMSFTPLATVLFACIWRKASIHERLERSGG